MPGDPLIYAAIGVGVVVIALAATLVPAREASRVDPLKVLRAE
jgi:ABC-type lipoprotein release transport system permease subunit